MTECVRTAGCKDWHSLPRWGVPWHGLCIWPDKDHVVSSASLPLQPSPCAPQGRLAPAALCFCGCRPLLNTVIPISGDTPNCPSPLTSPDCPKPLRRESWELPLGAPGCGPTCHKNSLISLCILVSAGPSMGGRKGSKGGRRGGCGQREIARVSLFHASPSPYPGRHPAPRGITSTGVSSVRL